MKLHLTGGTNEFVFDCKSTETVDDVTRDIALAHNLRDRVKRLAAGARELAKYGPMREEKDRGLTQAQIAGTASLKSGGADPLGMRPVST